MLFFNTTLIMPDIDFETIILNSLILIWIVTFYSAFAGNYFKSGIIRKIGLGLLFSLISIIVMTVPFELIEGYLFDTRTVLFSLSGVFLGFIPTVVMLIVSIIFRIYLGQEGMIIGIILFIISGGYGLLWKKYSYKFKNLNINLKYLIFSVISGVLPFITLLIYDYSLFRPYLPFISIYYLGALNLLTYILALILHSQKKSANLSNVIEEQKKLLQASIDSPKVMEIFVLDKDFKYLVFNSYHKYCMKLFYGVEIEVGDSFLEHIKNTKMYSRFRSQIYRALQGLEYTSVDEVETTKGKFYESMFTPIKNDNQDVIGVGIFSYDVTKKKQYEKNIIYLNYHDSLTGVYNRRYYNEEIIKHDTIENYPITILLADINSLKTVNDAFGHEKGDEMLKKSATILESVLSKHGFVSRIGGDEFVAVLKNTSKAMTANLINSLEKKISETRVAGVKLSLSIGYETIHENLSFEKAFKRAEDTMYRNKLFDKSADDNETINTIMKSLYEKNPREEMHSQRVSKYCVMIGEALKLSRDKLNHLKVGGILHDIGKIAIDDKILDKPGKLTEYEYEKVKKHPEIGYRILSASSQYIDISKDILHHHEHYDGKGYPRGLKEEEIPFNSRIICIADAYDAMTLSRPYRASLSKEEAIKELERCSGTQFDPDITKIFIDLIKDL
ncbi:MAG: diguanylate cyclase [Candidatus Izemoplasmatales bacterium]